MAVASLAWLAGACGSSAPESAQPTVTYTKDVAPLVFTHCASCHRPGGVGPFSVLTYADAKANAEAMASATRARQMPPWLPERGEFPIAGERRLRDDQIDLIQRWVAAGAPEGDPSALPPAPSFTEGWELGRPDVVLDLSKPYTASPGPEDIYRNLVLRTTLDRDVFVRAVELRTNGAPIHHAVIRVDRTSASRRRDGEDGQPGFAGMAWQSIQDPDGQFIGWAPGRGPIVSPEGMPWRLRRGGDLVVEVHLIPPESSFPVQPSIGLFLTDTPPRHTPLALKMGSKVIDIPPGEANYVVTDTYELPVDLDLLSLYPHAHYLGREMRVTAALPGASERTLLHIRHWSFHWQQDYRFVEPIALPRGTRLTMRYVFDNSEANPHNPRRPPVRVQAGPRSTDEMAELGLQVLPKSPQEAAVLVEAFDERERVANLAMAQDRVTREPGVAEHQALAGGTYAELGRNAEALPHLEAALRLGDRTAATRNYLGVALMGVGRPADAIAHFREAARLAPQDETPHFNLGNAFSRLSRPVEAEAAYRRALAINPEFPDAHVNLALLLFSTGRRDQALAHYARAAEILPDSAVVHSNYGGALAAAGRYQDAMRHVRRALEINPTYAPALQNLQRLQRMGIK